MFRHAVILGLIKKGKNQNRRPAYWGSAYDLLGLLQVFWAT
jgi:hypothetical protein